MNERVADRGSIVAWTYNGQPQVGTVEGVQDSPDGTVTLWLHRPGRRNRRGLELVARSLDEIVVVLTVAELADNASYYLDLAGRLSTGSRLPLGPDEPLGEDGAVLAGVLPGRICESDTVSVRNLAMEVER